MGNLSMHIYGYKNVHDVIVYKKMWEATASFSKVSVLLRLH